MALLPGQFTVRHVRPLGEGGLGVVDEVVVEDSNRSHPVGMRLARKQLGSQWANHPDLHARFDREIEIMRRMKHPTIVPLEGVSLPGNGRWYVMPLYAGSLRQALVAGRSFRSVLDVASFGVRLADALSHAHGMNFVHRDLKPENVLLDAADQPAIADWGVGQFIHKESKVLDLTKGGPMGTGYYASMEQWASGRCDRTGDVYSLGVVLAELAARRAIPINPIGAGIRQDVVPGHEAVNRTFNAIIRKMTGLFPADRYQSMTDVAYALRHVTMT